MTDVADAFMYRAMQCFVFVTWSIFLIVTAVMIIVVIDITMTMVVIILFAKAVLMEVGLLRTVAVILSSELIWCVVCKCRYVLHLAGQRLRLCDGR